MVSKNDLVEALLTEMYFYQQEFEKYIKEVSAIEHEMVGVKSPNLTGIHGTPEDRQHKLIRLGAKLKEMEDIKESYEIKYKNIYQTLHLSQLDDYDLRFLEYAYKKKYSGDDIAFELGYSDRKGVWRKRIHLLEKIGEML